MQQEKPVYKKLSSDDFAASEVIRDRAGNVFITRRGVADLLGVSLQTLNTTCKLAGLRPLDRFIKQRRPYMLEDVEAFYNRRQRR